MPTTDTPTPSPVTVHVSDGQDWVPLQLVECPICHALVNVKAAAEHAAWHEWLCA